MLLGGAHRQYKERRGENVARNHHRQVQSVIIAHHGTIKHTEHRTIGGNSQRQLAAGSRNHQPPERFVFFHDSHILRDPDLLLLFTSQSKILRLVFLPDADYRKHRQ